MLSRPPVPSLACSVAYHEYFTHPDGRELQGPAEAQIKQEKRRSRLPGSVCVVSLRFSVSDGSVCRTLLHIRHKPPVSKMSYLVSAFFMYNLERSLDRFSPPCVNYS